MQNITVLTGNIKAAQSLSTVVNAVVSDHLANELARSRFLIGNQCPAYATSWLCNDHRANNSEGELTLSNELMDRLSCEKEVTSENF